MDIEALRKDALAAVQAADSPEKIEEARIKYLGRKDGKVTGLLRSLKDLSIEERRKTGPRVQTLEKEIRAALDEKAARYSLRSTRSSVDLTAPGKKASRGHLHPLTLVEEEIRRIFLGMSFSIVDGPEMETEYYNFDALNIPAGHPARDMWDTFWIKPSVKAKKQERHLLRTHTSPMQVRYMEGHEPPFQIVVPGRCFRYEALDASHQINFYQLEGLMVGKDVSMANFKFVVEEFFGKFFKTKIDFRYRPSYFPFVEPGLEVDVKLRGKWLEVMGAGMVNQRVFEYAHYNPGDWQGFAFGMGIERLAMIKYDVPDIRLFYSGDLRFIKQF